MSETGYVLFRLGERTVATGLDDVWGMHNTTVMAMLSLAVVAAFAALMLGLAMRVFSRAAIK